MRGVAWSGDAAGSIDMIGLLSAITFNTAGSAAPPSARPPIYGSSRMDGQRPSNGCSGLRPHDRQVDANLARPLAPTLWVRRALTHFGKRLHDQSDTPPTAY